MDIFLGIDLGSSGCRVIAIDGQARQIAEFSAPWPASIDDPSLTEQDPWMWWETLSILLHKLTSNVPPQNIRALAVGGTSGTILLCDERGEPLCQALMYHDMRARDEVTKLSTIAPREFPVHCPSSALSKLLYLQQQPGMEKACYALHQADWVAGKLCGQYGVSDENNCLKLGYDVRQRCWPDWFDALDINKRLLPRVVSPGTAIGTIDRIVGQQLGLHPDTAVVAGTTDGVAAFLASGAKQVGEAATSLGSTLVIKLLSDQYINSWEHGLYSHRIHDKWLVGGASNCGGAVVLQYFTKQQLKTMTPQLNPQQPTGLNYYPLPSQGERFPINDPDKQPLLTPRPDDDVKFLQGILEGIADVEARSYQLLSELGAPYPTTVYSVGGGSCNQYWSEMREQRLSVPVKNAAHQQAAYGVALLARSM